MSEEEGRYDVEVTLKFHVKAKSEEHARLLVENGLSFAYRLGHPASKSVSVSYPFWGNLRPTFTG